LEVHTRAPVVDKTYKAILNGWLLQSARMTSMQWS
jgi:hypothetical protein